MNQLEGLDHVPNNLTLGLEEFNLSESYLQLKVAFIPAFRTQNIPGFFEQVHLCHIPQQNEGNHVYATLNGVRQIQQDEINAWRESLENEPNPFDHGAWNADHELFDYDVFYRQAYDICLAQNEIVGNGNDGSFPINVTYDDIDIHFDPGNPGEVIGNPVAWNGNRASILGHWPPQ